MAAAGIADIRLAYPIQPSNAPRLLALMERASLSIVVDHAGVARAWSDAMRRAESHARCARQGRRRLPSMRHRSRCVRTFSISSAPSRRCPDSDCAVSSAMPAMVIRPLRPSELSAIATARGRDSDDDARSHRCATASRSRRFRLEPRPRCATACCTLASPSSGPATTCTSIARSSRSELRRLTIAP